MKREYNNKFHNALVEYNKAELVIIFPQLVCKAELSSNKALKTVL
jgi:hypothetical protein